MEEFDELETELSSANMEMRYIAIELMKISIREKKPFLQVAKEYVENVYTLKNIIEQNEKFEAGKNERKH